ncbi:MAG: hypothetical protein H0X35_13525 [Pseudonocardiales bacterium]|nr:hypothetical protein [Pseudonocardiales bacterium]
MLLDERGLDEYTDRFAFEAIRQEVLDLYDVPSDGGDFGRYLAGARSPDPAVIAPWCDWVRDRRRRGGAVRRVRVLQDQPTRYVCFECEWAYAYNVAAGEEIRVLDLTEVATPAGFVADDFWLLDRARAVVMEYDIDGHFQHGEALEGTAARPWVAARDAAWAAAEPFTDWWHRHPEYHRAAWLEGASA